MAALPKPKLVAWLVSNCDTSKDSRREQYVRRLRQHVPVDILGDCGNQLPEFTPADNRARFQHLERNYKFYLSFENSICTDYATEKLFNALRADIVPVVLGGANYSAIAPPRSYISVLDFPTIKELAEELERLAANQKDYLEYFWWKVGAPTLLMVLQEHYDVHDMPEGRQAAMCRLCSSLHSPLHHSSYADISSWLGKDQCKVPAW